MIIVTPSFSNNSVFKLFSAKPAFSLNSPGFKFLRFRDGLVWTVGLTVEKEPRCQISLA